MTASLLYGVHPTLEAFKAGLPIEAIYLAAGLDPARAADFERLARDRRVPVERVDRSRLDKLTRGGVHQGVALRLRETRSWDLEDLVTLAQEAGPKGLILALDGIEDPHNLGALVRSAFALGAQGVVIPKDRAASLSPAAIKASAGAAAHLPVATVTNLVRALERLKEAGLWVVGADLSGDRRPEEVDLHGPIVLVIGAEGQGIRRLAREACDFRVRIPMTGPLASLNASVSGAILLYEVARQRRSREPSETP